MPNWCAQNYVLRGKTEDIERFCNTVNSCLEKPDVMENGFGKYWLGNLCVAFGYQYSNDISGLRGCFDPCAENGACFFGPPDSTDKVYPTGTGPNTSLVAFTVHHAWGPSEWFENMLKEKFPDCEYGWQATDEFGNYHVCHNPKLIGCPIAEIRDTFGETEEFTEPKEVVEYIKNETGLDVTEEEFNSQSDSFFEKICDWNDKHPDEGIFPILWAVV